ncbi:hypothetical protein CCR95_19010 [Thiocystis minor]|uniref:alginate O-acetyltransferase AlgX-related protein n=1 Tax=Thiocystis minor TaxID=61597 RepID=UPI001912CF13|nr:hypothetical protein [Thiocystis minor]MBK5966112.1 hypothetical protein [Thiocystis minor]
MKRSVIAFFFITGFAIMVVPALNFSLATLNVVKYSKKETSATLKESKMWQGKGFYNIDFLMPWLGKIGYYFGISISPKQFVIGREGWLFLGDAYAKSITVKRISATKDNLVKINRIAVNTTSWWLWLKKNGVKLYRIQLASDKSTIYPEYLPQWAKPVADHATNKLRERVNPAIYIDNKAALLEAKSQYGKSLYYRTDSHWNSFGAWIAYLDLAETIRKSGFLGIQWLTPNHVRFMDRRDIPGGDIAGFLWMKDILSDIEVPMKIDIGRPLFVEHINFQTKKSMARTNNLILKESPKPILVKSPNALNKARLLWLRDSFGTKISPLMAATFSEILQLHYNKATSEIFSQMVLTFKPDYIIITSVERNSLSDWFQQPPPE